MTSFSDAIREGATDAELLAVIGQAVAGKKKQHAGKSVYKVS